MGKHYLLNLYGCSLSLLDNEFFLCDLLENAAEACGAHVLQTMSHQFKPQGVTQIEKENKLKEAQLAMAMK